MPDGVLHTVYSYSPGGGDDCDSFYRQIDRQRRHLGPEIRLHDDATTSDQFFPTLSVGAGNIVRQPGTTAGSIRTTSWSTTIRRSRSTAVVTWEPSQRLSDVSTPIYLDPNLATCYHGDYDTHIQTSTHAVTQWSDDRNMANITTTRMSFPIPFPSAPISF